MERKEFIKTGCAFCVGALLFGAASSLGSCTSALAVTKTISNNTITLLPSDFLESKTLIVKTNSLPFYLLCIRVSDTEYRTLEMKCSHQEQPLNFNGEKLQCSSHGSAFDLEGNVLIPPANAPLHRFRTEKISNQIIIHLT
jgi:nitrite reductase/ring-hydroxylating ferredoxin subunit